MFFSIRSKVRSEVRFLSIAASLAALAAALNSQSVLAQPVTSTMTTGSANTSGGTDTWQFSAGMGVMSRAKYPGSSETKTTALPLFSANYGRFFIGGVPNAGVPLGAGVNLLQSGPWRAGVAVGFNPGKARRESDAARLKGMGDIDGTVMGSVFGSYDDKYFAVKSSLVTDVGGKNQGTRFSMDLEGKYAVSDRLMFSAGPGFTWADSKYTQTYFGVTAAQSASSGLAAYSASSGLNNVRFSLGANYKLTPQWGLMTRITTESLRGDAVKSPLTEKKSQNSLGVFANYRF